MKHRQLPLQLRWSDGYGFDNYVAGANRALVQEIERSLSAPGHAALYFWGGAGVGKSHLLQASCGVAAQAGRSAAYLPLVELISLHVDLLQGLEQVDVVCIDDLHVIAADHEWQMAVFHLYNRVRDCGGLLLLAGNQPPPGLGFTLPDLVSRLGWGLQFQVRELSDAEKSAALQLRAQRRGLDMPNDVASYLIHHSPRDMGSLFVLLDRLDEASLAAQRKLTVPFVRSLFQGG